MKGGLYSQEFLIIHSLTFYQIATVRKSRNKIDPKHQDYDTKNTDTPWQREKRERKRETMRLGNLHTLIQQLGKIVSEGIYAEYLTAMVTMF
jgi:hypothetical protein